MDRIPRLCYVDWMIELARKEYDRLVRLPFSGPERHYNNRYMAFLRDFIAEAEGRSAEEVQTEYEDRGNMDAMNQRASPVSSSLFS